jgi:hypothetical protein
VVPTSAPSISPSWSPTSSPSSRPSSLPSIYPSLLPTDSPSIQPSMVPSSLPSLDPCKGYDGNFGNTTGDISVNIYFNYGVERDKTTEANMKIALSDQVAEVEQRLLDILISRFFDECKERRNLLQNILSGGKPTAHVEPSHFNIMNQNKNDRTPRVFNGQPSNESELNPTKIVGISSSPVDLANGRKYTYIYLWKLCVLGGK